MFNAFREKHSDEVFKEVPSPKDGALFHRCTFHKLNGAILKDCKMYGSTFAMTKPEDIIGLTATMDCDFFSMLELSPEVFDYMLLLLCRTKGNNDKRMAIIEKVVGHDTAFRLLKETELLEDRT